VSYNRDNAGAGALEFARKLAGRPYVYGGWPTNGSGTDCSGLWEWAYLQVGIDIRRTTFGQYLEFPLARDEPYQVGDLIFIAGSDPIGAEPGHVMGYSAPGRVFQAPETGMRIGEYDYDTTQFEYRTRPSLFYPVIHPQPRTKHPTPEQIKQRELTPLHNGQQARLALNNGWALFKWDGYEFTRAVAHRWGTLEYANVKFATKRV
jgi:hypothetical protein